MSVFFKIMINMKKHLFIFCLFLFIGYSGYSQVSEIFRTKYNLAESYLNDGNFQDAITYISFSGYTNSRQSEC